MSATQFAPDALGVCDDGCAPVVFIDGLAAHVEAGGIVRVALYANQPVIDPAAQLGDPCDFVKVVVLKLIYTTAAKELMRRQVIQQLGDSVKPSDLVGVHH